MIKSRTAQLIYQTIYCVLGLVGIIACFGIFDDYTNLRWDFYVHFTNISNFLCIGIMFVALVQTIRKKQDSFVTTLPFLKFVGVLSILLTFLVFNLMLAGAPGRDPQLNLRIGSLLFHGLLPVMFIADWFLFYERKKTNWYYPIASVSFPLLYVICIFIQAAALSFDSSILIPNTTTPLIYPYFFLNLDKLGTMGVVQWVAILFVAFIAVGYIFFLLDKISKKRKAKAI